MKQEGILYNRIKDELETKDIKQIWLTERLGLNFRAVNMYETYAVQPPIPILYKSEEILNVEVSDLLNKKENLTDLNGRKRD
jgi:transcriptional regulator with XRE-family HTH domain